MAAKKKSSPKKKVAPAKKASTAKKPATTIGRLVVPPKAAPAALSTVPAAPVAPPAPAEDPNVDIVRIPKTASGPELVNANTLVGRATIHEITDEATSAQANAILVELAAAKKAVKARQDHMLQPAQETVKRIRALWEPMILQLTTADQTLRERTLRYINAQRTLREAEQKKLLTDAVAAKAEGDSEKASELAGQSAAIASSAPKTRTLDTGGYVQTKELTKFEVTDLGAVPREYLELSSKAVNAAIKAGVTEIPGIRIYKDSTLAVGTGSVQVDIEA